MAGIIDWIATPMGYAFMVRGLLASLIVGTVCAVLGTFVVLRGMAFLGDALSHAILPGMAVGYLVGGGDRGPLFWWALGTGVATSLAIGAVTRRGQIREDAAIGVIFAGMFALGITIISTVRSYSVDLTHFLFGDVLGVNGADLVRTGGFGALMLILVVLLFKEFTVMSFDPVLAATLRMPTTMLHYLLMAMLAVTIVISVQTVGVALMMAMLVTPAAAAYMLTRRLIPMILTAVGIGAFSAVAGLYISYYTNVVSGAAIVLVATAIFLLTMVFAPQRGALWNWLRTARRTAEG